MEKIFENEYAELYSLEPALKFTIFGYWKGFWMLSDEEAMRALRFPLSYIPEHQIKIMITDYSFLDVVPEETNQWLSEVWFPEVVKGGLLAEIIIDAQHLTGKLSVEYMYENINTETGLSTPMVSSLEEAKQLARMILNERGIDL
jgi:hypothetical protein